MATSTWDHEFDLVVVGSGAGGMLSAIVARDRGHRAVVLEKEPKWGGTSAWSGGGMWLPNNPLMARDGAGDSFERAMEYMNAVIDYDGPASSPARREAFVRAAPQVAQYLMDQGMELIRAEQYPDYYPEEPGGMIGRGLEGVVFDGRRLGPWLETLGASPGGDMPMAMTTRDVHYLPEVMRTWAGFVGTMKMMLKTVWWLITFRKPLGIGRAMLAHLMHIAQRHEVPVWLETKVVELVQEGGRVVGVVVERNGKRERIRARAGVMLAAGGFAKNASLRRQHQPVGDAFTSVAPGDTGDAIRLGEGIDAAIELMDDAWWGPAFLMPGGQPAFAVTERSLPHSILVDEGGQRFTNESCSYVDAGHDMLNLTAGEEVAPTWLIMDARHRRRYVMGTTPPMVTPKEWFDTEHFHRADTLAELAAKAGIDPAGLAATVERFNGFARTGKDEDFGRGDSAYDRYYGDHSVKPNPNLGAIEQGPFIAARMVPGDLGTKGGLTTDEHARVLRTDGSVIDGLYATGNTTASVMGRTYPGPGSTLGPSVTFGWLGANHAVSMLESERDIAEAS